MTIFLCTLYFFSLFPHVQMFPHPTLSAPKSIPLRRYSEACHGGGQFRVFGFRDHVSVVYSLRQFNESSYGILNSVPPLHGKCLSKGRLRAPFSPPNFPGNPPQKLFSTFSPPAALSQKWRVYFFPECMWTPRPKIRWGGLGYVKMKTCHGN